ncbi:MAG: DUF1428 domain-containing protein [Pseudomonadota bacterium]
MTYIDGFVLAVPNANKQKFIDHAQRADPMFAELGATRIFECWGDDVPDGKVTDFKGAVQATDDETVAFSWIEWPDKATRDAAMKTLTEQMEGKQPADPRMDPKLNPMPFDGQRMIFGGFETLIDEGESGATNVGYTDGFVTPVPEGKREEYRIMADKAAGIFREHGAIRSLEAWGDDVPAGKQTDFARAVKAKDDEKVVFSWLEWPDKATRDAGWAKIMEDERMKPDEMPFDGKRMFWGGFEPVVTIGS